MQLDVRLLQGVALFKGVAPEDFGGLFHCIGARKERYAKGEFILLNGNVIGAIGIILHGRAQIIKEDIFGNRTILNDLGPKSVFGEAFVCGGSYVLTVSVLAVETSEVLFLPFHRVMQPCSAVCVFHRTLIQNMVEMLARKNLKLVEKLEVTTKHSLREKLLTYLSQLVQEQGSNTVTAPLGRVDLAAFLGVDRSALTRELNRMRDVGLIAFDRNRFTVLTADLP